MLYATLQKIEHNFRIQVLEQELIEVERNMEERYRRASECLGGELQPLNPGEIEDLDDPDFRPRSRSHRPRAR